MGDLTKNISRSEVACKCGCGFDTLDIETANVVQDVRDHFGKPVILTSVCRCVTYNHQIGGKPGSQHIYGRAADIVVMGISPHDVYAYLVTKYPDKYGLGSYRDFTHIDTKSGKARRW